MQCKARSGENPMTREESPWWEFLNRRYLIIGILWKMHAARCQKLFCFNRNSSHHPILTAACSRLPFERSPELNMCESGLRTASIISCCSCIGGTARPCDVMLSSNSCWTLITESSLHRSDKSSNEIVNQSTDQWNEISKLKKFRKFFFSKDYTELSGLNRLNSANFNSPHAYKIRFHMLGKCMTNVIKRSRPTQAMAKPKKLGVL